MSLSAQRRHDLLDALRRGTVPQSSLDVLAVGLEPFETALQAELDTAARGGAVFKAVRGEYGSGKTFLARWLQETGRRRGFASAEVQISETETPLHRVETVYRRLMERLSTAAVSSGALRSVVDGWFFALEQDVLAEGLISEGDSAGLLARTNEVMEQRLAGITRTAPGLAAALRGYRAAVAAGERAVADGLVAWISGQPNVGAAIKRCAGIKGDIDHFGALSALQALLVMLRDSGHAGLVAVLDEVETLQRMRGDVRDRSLNALRQLIDEVDAGRFPGLYLLITGTPAFFDGPQGISRLTPLAQRLHVDFTTDARFDNPRAVQIRLQAFTHDRLMELGRKVRDIFADGSSHSERIRSVVDDPYLHDLAHAVTGSLGGKVGVVPRIFLKKLVVDILDRVDQFPDFDPRRHYSLTIASEELTPAERSARGASSPDEVEIDL